MIDKNASILLIYTGGTIGMVENTETSILEPFNFDHLNKKIPEIQQLKFKVEHIVFTPILDSSDILPEHWVKMAKLIEQNYDKYDGFVILHGTDTMAYTSSALSFMIENLNKPIILTGAQLPIGKLRSDARENLITALEIAADKTYEGESKIQEVCIFFQNYLLRGNRASKINADNFNAFKSFNMPFLAKSGINIKYNEELLLKCKKDSNVKYNYNICSEVVVLKIFPGINKEVVSAIINIPNLKGIVIETYGSGNAPLLPWFIELLQEAITKGIQIVNITQCVIGFVNMTRYKTGVFLQEIGVISGDDLTVEAALTKLMILLGDNKSPEKIKKEMSECLAGEISRTDRIRDFILK